MILVDTSIWIEHLRNQLPAMVTALNKGLALGHPWVTGEVALGHLGQRAEILTLLRQLPQAAVAQPEELLTLIEDERLFGLGIGYVDAQLLASARLTPETRLWTRDVALRNAAEQVGVAHRDESAAPGER